MASYNRHSYEDWINSEFRNRRNYVEPNVPVTLPLYIPKLASVEIESPMWFFLRRFSIQWRYFEELLVVFDCETQTSITINKERLLDEPRKGRSDLQIVVDLTKEALLSLNQKILKDGKESPRL